MSLVVKNKQKLTVRGNLRSNISNRQAFTGSVQIYIYSQYKNTTRNLWHTRHSAVSNLNIRNYIMYIVWLCTNTIYIKVSKFHLYCQPSTKYAYIFSNKNIKILKLNNMTDNYQLGKYRRLVPNAVGSEK